jgi:hypothetical protein
VNDSPAPVLYHFSEDPSIRRFEPRIAPSSAVQEELVWAVDADHSYLYYFPRDCPRVTFYASERTTEADRERFFGHTMATHVSAIESAWLERLQATRLNRYLLPSQGFECILDTAGYWVSHEAVSPLAVEPVGDLMQASAEAGVELRIMPSLWPLRDAVIASTLEFSIIRWRNASPKLEFTVRSD